MLGLQLNHISKMGPRSANDLVMNVFYITNQLWKKVSCAYMIHYTLALTKILARFANNTMGQLFLNATQIMAVKYHDRHRISLWWRHNDHAGVSNHQPHGCLFNRLFRRKSKKTSKLRVTGLCAGNSPGPVNFPHKWPVTRKMFPFDDVIMCLTLRM